MYRIPGTAWLILLAVSLSLAGATSGCDGGGGGDSGAASPAPAIQFEMGGFDGPVEAVAPAADGSGAVWYGGRFEDFGGSPAPGIARLDAGGAQDPAFSPGTGFDWPVHTLCLAPDGSEDVYVGGSFTMYDGAPAGGLVRLDASGAVDPSFAIGTGFDGIVSAIVAADDVSGDVYVGGSFTLFDGTAAPGIVRLRPNGTRASGFSAGAGFTGSPREIALANDGSGDLFVGGAFTQYDGSPAANLVRLRPDGSLAPGFSIGSGFNSTVLALVAVADGSGDLIVGGNFDTLDGASAPRIIRLGGDGSVAAGFSFGAGFDGPVHDLRIATGSTGDLWVAGAFSQFAGASAPGLIRLAATGTLAPGFSSGEGFEGGSPLALATAVDGSGDIHVGGGFTRYSGHGANHAVRIDSNGSPDLSFSLVGGFDAPVRSIEWTVDGSAFYAAGEFIGYAAVRSPGIIRFDSRGEVDPGFAAGDGFDGAVAMVAPAVDDSGDLLVIGSFSTYDGAPAARLARLRADGAAAPGFSIGSGFSTPPSSFAFLSTIAPAEDGSGDLYVGGSFGSYDGFRSPGIVRIDPSGEFDPAFDVGSGTDGWVRAIAPAGDGSGDLYVAGGFTDFDDVDAHGIVRLDSDGSLDPAFSTGTGFDSIVYAVAVALDGSGAVYAGGIFSSYDGAAVPCAVRLSATGALDTGFVLPAGLAGECVAITPAMDGTGDIFLVLDQAGSEPYGVVRVDPSGAIDPGFAPGSGSNGFVASIARARDGSGRLLVGGNFKAWNGERHDHAVCLGPDGNPD